MLFEYGFFAFTLGAGELLRGLDVSLAGMCEGQTRTLTVPPQLGYGNMPHPLPEGSIPPNTDLHFEVELLKVLPPATRVAVYGTLVESCGPGHWWADGWLPPSHQCDGGSSDCLRGACLQCPKGKYQLAAGQRRCRSCPGGKSTFAGDAACSFQAWLNQTVR